MFMVKLLVVVVEELIYHYSRPWFVVSGTPVPRIHHGL